MKKYILYILTGVAACGLCSCEDALDRYPKDRLTPDNFFHTEEECQLYTNDFYTMFPSAGTIYGETADIIAKTTLTSEVLGNRTVPATAGSWKWEKLRDINFFLQYSSNCADEHVRLEYEGVARFFRAWFYFEKVKHYGDVPWVDRPIDAGDPLLFEKGRDPREMVMQKVIEDLDFAVTNLPVERSVYRVTRWAALALKSRVCLFEGTFRKYHGLKDWESYLTACATASKRFIDESGYSVYTTGTTPYLNLFSSLKALDTEIVLARAYNTAIGLKHDVNGYLTSITMGRPGLLKNIANMYLMKDGTPFTSQPGWETMQLPEESKNRDGRFAQTVRTPGYKRIDDTALSAPNLAATMTGYQLVKYLQSAKYDSYNASTNDLPLLRAAEVMLNYAEAKAELGTLTQEDIDLAIKPLRDRAGVANLSLTKANASPDPYLASPETGYANVTGDNKGVILEIRRERTVELLMENLRYWDIMRWKEGKRFEKPFTGLYFPGTGSYDLNNDGVDDVCIWSGSKPATSAPAVYELNKEIFLSGGDSGYIIIHTDYARSWNEERDYLYPVPTEPDPYLASPETGYANVTGDNKGVILEIRRERTVELLMENLRYWDIMRWKEGKRFEKPFTGLYFPGTGSYDLNNDGVDDVCIWSGSKPATSAPAVYELNKEIFLSGGDSGYIIIHTDYARSWNEERDYLYPVPTDDRVLTQGAITQNPGWNDGLNF